MKTEDKHQRILETPLKKIPAKKYFDSSAKDHSPLRQKKGDSVQKSISKSMMFTTSPPAPDSLTPNASTANRMMSQAYEYKVATAKKSTNTQMTTPTF
jgi:hypothetical protein